MISSKIYFSLNKYEENIINFFIKLSIIFFCKKSINKPSCQINSLRKKKLFKK